MMILNFINIKTNNKELVKLIRKRFIFFFLLAFINSIEAATNQSKFDWTCNNKKECGLFAIMNQGRKTLVYKGNQADKNHIGFRDYGDNLGSFIISCGSPCSYTTFVNFQTGEISKQTFFLVKAVDPVHEEVAYLGKNIEISPIFGNYNKKRVIERDYSAGASLSVGKIRFVNANTIFVKYVVGKNFIPREEKIIFKQK